MIGDRANPTLGAGGEPQGPHQAVAGWTTCMTACLPGAMPTRLLTHQKSAGMSSLRRPGGTDGLP